MDAKLTKDMMEVAAIRTQMRRCLTAANIPPQIRDMCSTLDDALTLIQRAQSLKLAKLCGQTTVDDATVKSIATDGMSLIMEAVTAFQDQRHELSDPFAELCDKLCTWILQNMDCILTKLRADT